MSMATQLRRGALALPLLAMFALLAIISARTPVQARWIANHAVPARVCLLAPARAHGLWLAQTPADLETPGQWRPACRA